MTAEPATSAAADTPAESVRRWPAWQTVAEVVIIFLTFAVAAGSPPPAVNEAHYLAKAKHFWEPTWLAGDFFLESADAHYTFYLTLGWVTKLLPLPAAAWVLRGIIWLLLAIGWQRLSRALFPIPWVAPWTAALFLAAQVNLQMAGEWVVGGAEAKGVAYALAFIGFAAAVRRDWTWCWAWFGAAAAFHVLVGGWCVVAGGVAWLLLERNGSKLPGMLPGLILGLVLSLPGLVPGLWLSWGVGQETINTANESYVFVRLSHHLILKTFSPELTLRLGAAALGWVVLAGLLIADRRQRRLHALVLGAVVIAALGGLIEQLTLTYQGESLSYVARGWPLDEQQTLWRPQWAAALLRYYWYRLADVMIPLGLVFGAVRLLLHWQAASRPAALQAVAYAGVVLTLSLAGWHLWIQASQDRPQAASQAWPEEDYQAWLKLTAWVRASTPRDAGFVTRGGRGTFKWYARRREAFSFKDAPQDAPGLARWRQRFEDLYYRKLPALRSPEEIRRLARRYDFEYVVTPTRIVIDGKEYTIHPRFELDRVYPPPWVRERGAYEIYRVPRDDDSPSPN